MIQFSDAIQYEEPFPFIHFDQTLDVSFFKKLQKNFPSDYFFKDLPIVQGDRKDLGRWRKEFLKFINAQKDWKEFYNFCQSRDFCNLILKKFEKNWNELAIKDIQNFEFSKSIIGYENRAQRLKKHILKSNFYISLLDLIQKKEPLSVSFSIATQSGGYESPPHADSRHKIIAFLIYFDDCENFGELNIHSVKKTTTPEFDNSGYIKSKVSIFKKIIPKPNTGVLLWNNRRAIHSVPFISKDIISKRRFIYISIASSRRLDCWNKII